MACLRTNPLGSSHIDCCSAGSTTTSLGAYFPALASNMLGSFFMGLAASAATLGIKQSSKAVGCLPHHHPWQSNEALHTGVRTGYCGSLTTFASWELSMVYLLIGGTVRAHRSCAACASGHSFGALKARAMIDKCLSLPALSKRLPEQQAPDPVRASLETVTILCTCPAVTAMLKHAAAVAPPLPQSLPWLPPGSKALGPHGSH